MVSASNRNQPKLPKRMKKEYIKPIVDTTPLTARWAMCVDGTGEGIFSDPNPAPYRW